VRVLIVDDEPLARRGVIQRLRHFRTWRSLGNVEMAFPYTASEFIVEAASAHEQTPRTPRTKSFLAESHEINKRD
jgi:hypothetical protein